MTALWIGNGTVCRIHTHTETYTHTSYKRHDNGNWKASPTQFFGSFPIQFNPAQYENVLSLHLVWIDEIVVAVVTLVRIVLVVAVIHSHLLAYPIHWKLLLRSFDERLCCPSNISMIHTYSQRSIRVYDATLHVSVRMCACWLLCESEFCGGAKIRIYSAEDGMAFYIDDVIGQIRERSTWMYVTTLISVVKRQCESHKPVHKAAAISIILSFLSSYIIRSVSHHFSLALCRILLQSATVSISIICRIGSKSNGYLVMSHVCCLR